MESLNPFSRIDGDGLLEVQRYQYTERLFLSAVVPAGTHSMGKVAVSNLGHFALAWMTGHFTTIWNVAAVATDTGVCPIRAKMIDGSNQRTLFNDYIPADLFLSPGRTRDISALAGADPSGNLFVPTEFVYLFPANSEIQFDLVNDSDVDNRIDICFHGIRIKSKAALDRAYGSS